MSGQPMSESDFSLLIRTLEAAKRMDESRIGLAYTALGALEALCNMTEEQVATLRKFLYEGD